MQQTGGHRVTTLEALEALYDKPYGPAIVKEIDRINPHYRKFIEAAPFCQRQGAAQRHRGRGRARVLSVHQSHRALEIVGSGAPRRSQELASAGTILGEISGGQIGGPDHDRAQPQRIKETLY